MTEVAIWGYSLTAVAYTLFGFYLFFAWRGGVQGGALLAAVGSSAIWAVLSALLGIFPQTTWMYSLVAVADVLRMGGWFIFLLMLLAPLAGGKRLRWPRFLATACVLITLFAVLSFGFVPVRDEAPARWMLGGFLGGAVLGLVLIEQLYRSLPNDFRWGLKPMCLGLAAGYVFELYFFADAFLFVRLDEDIWSVRGVVHAMVIPLVAVSAARTSSWTVHIAVSREMVFHSTALAVSGLYLLIVSAAGYYVRFFGGEWGRALQLTLLFGGLLLLLVFVFSATQRARLRVFLSKHLFPYRYDYRNEWLRFTHALSTAGGSMDLGQSVIKALADLVESSGGGLWLKDASGRFSMQARLNHAASDGVEVSESPFCRFIDEHEWIFDMEEWRARPLKYQGLNIPAWLSNMSDAWLVVPLKSSGTLVGFVVLNNARTRFEVNWEVLDLLKTAQRQAASYLARMQATEALLESRKFDSFNRMSAFVVHDLKNLVAQLSLMLKNAERHKHNPVFQEDMIETVSNVEARMRTLMRQLQEKTSIQPRKPVDLNALLKRIQADKAQQQPAVTLGDQSARSIEVHAHPERLERVIGHLVQNAIDATPDDGNVIVSMAAQSEEFVRLTVEDSGCGMSPEFMRDFLFKPFQSSKTSGMGIGVYEAQQYIGELGGTLVFESEQQRGTRAIVTLPCMARNTAPAPSLAILQDE